MVCGYACVAVLNVDRPLVLCVPQITSVFELYCMCMNYGYVFLVRNSIEYTSSW